MNKITFIFAPGTSLMFMIGTHMYKVTDRTMISNMWKQAQKGIDRSLLQWGEDGSIIISGEYDNRTVVTFCAVADLVERKETKVGV